MTQWLEHLHAATVIGRWTAAHKARELGYALLPDRGPSGDLGHWTIAGIPQVVMNIHSKRAAQIDAACNGKGVFSSAARGVAALATVDKESPVAMPVSMERWQVDYSEAGYPLGRLLEDLVENAANPSLAPMPLDGGAIAAVLLGPYGRLTKRKVFTGLDVVVAVAVTQPQNYGRPVEDLFRVVDRVLADPEAIPLPGSPRCGGRAYSTATTINGRREPGKALAPASLGVTPLATEGARIHDQGVTLRSPGTTNRRL